MSFLTQEEQLGPLSKDHIAAYLAKRGIDEPYDRVSTFFTELFGTAYKFFGDSAATDHIELEGDFGAGRALVRYYRGGDLHAALLTGQSEEREGELQERIRSDALAATA